MRFINYLVKILLIILTGAVCWQFGYPQYKEKAKIYKRYRVRVNMHVLRAAVENYSAFNGNKYPKKIEEIEPFYNEFVRKYKQPVNPYNGKIIKPEEIKIFKYDSKEEVRNIAIDSKNGRMRGIPGGLAYGIYIPENDSIPSAYGIIGFDENGEPIIEVMPSGEKHVIVLYE